MAFHNDKNGHRKPSLPLRLVMKLLSVVLCLVLVVSLLGTVLLMDARALTSSGGIQKIITSLLSSGGSAEPEVDPTVDPAMSALTVHLLSDTVYPEGYTVDEDGNIIAPDGTIVGNVNDYGDTTPEDSENTGDVSISLDMLTDSDALAEYLCGLAQDYLGEDAEITPEQVKSFVEESTVSEFIADKVSSYADDIINGTENTTISVDDIMQLVEDNQTLIEDTFQIEITEEHKTQLSTQVEQTLQESDLNNTIRENINSAMEEPVPGMEDTTVNDLMEIVRKITQTKTVILAVVLCLVLMAILCGLNFYALPSGLRFCAFGCLLAGLILSAPLIILQFAPGVLSNLLPSLSGTLALVAGVASVMAPMHYGVLILGVVLLVLSFLWKILFRR